MTNNKSRPMALLTAGLFWVGMAQAQESVNASGGSATGSEGTAAYSVGQVVYTANTGSSGSAAQGVQHAYEVFTVGIKETALDIILSVFPNPATENLTLQIDHYNDEKLAFQVYDIRGKLLNKGQIVARQTEINMRQLPAATYFIHIANQENKKIQSFKIMKR